MARSILVILKPSIFFIILSTLRWAAAAIIFMLAGVVFDEHMPGKVRTYIEIGSIVLVGRLVCAASMDEPALHSHRHAHHPPGRGVWAVHLFGSAAQDREREFSTPFASASVESDRSRSFHPTKNMKSVSGRWSAGRWRSMSRSSRPSTRPGRDAPGRTEVKPLLRQSMSRWAVAWIAVSLPEGRFLLP